jgi:hypothetical protein
MICFFQVILPTGTYVTVDFSSLSSSNIQIYADLEDVDSVVGMCGTYNHNPDDDLMDPDGTVYQLPTDVWEQPDQFLTSWW